MSMRELDVEALPFQGRHDAIVTQLDRLDPGQEMVLVSEHMPLPLRFHLQDARPGVFRWSYVTWGRPEWRVAVTRVR
jgi:uncharacterized protein (DUF2249 family)